MTESKLSRKVLASIILLCFAGQIAWTVENQYFNVFLYNVIIPDPVYISYLVALSAVASTATSILIGAYSDAKTTRWGKRKPFLLLGYPIWGIVTALFPAATLLRPAVVAAWFAILWDCIMTFFGAAAYDANFNAYVIDVTTVENRGKVMGIVSLLSSVALLLIYSFAGFFIQQYGYFSFFYLVGGVVSVLGTIGALLVAEPPFQAEEADGVLSRIKESFSREFIGKNRDVFILLLASSIQGLGVQVFFPYIILYLQHYLEFPLDLASILMFIALLIGVIVAIPCGIVVDKVGRKKVVMVSLPLCCAALYAFSFAKSVPETLALGIAWVSFLTCNNVAVSAWLRDLYPEEKRGEFSGYNILFGVAFTMIPGPFIGSWLTQLYGERKTINGETALIPAPVIFQAGSIIMLFSVLLLLRARETLQRKCVKPTK